MVAVLVEERGGEWVGRLVFAKAEWMAPSLVVWTVHGLVVSMATDLVAGTAALWVAQPVGMSGNVRVVL